jgi:large subunit ribosomal protein L21
MYAIVRCGGGQYQVAEGETIEVTRLQADEGDIVELNEVLLISDDQHVSVGQPLVEGAGVRARVVRHVKGPKVVVQKYKPKTRYRVKVGYRDSLSRLLIEKIVT